MAKLPKPSMNFKKKNKINGQTPAKARGSHVQMKKKLNKAADKVMFGGRYSK